MLNGKHANRYGPFFRHDAFFKKIYIAAYFLIQLEMNLIFTQIASFELIYFTIFEIYFFTDLSPLFALKLILN